MAHNAQRPRLPNELMQEVIHHADRPTLRNLRLVASSTKAMAEPRLSGTVFIKNSKDNISNAFRIKYHPILKQQVKHMYYDGDICSWLHWFVKNAGPNHAIITAWKAGTNIFQLSLLNFSKLITESREMFHCYTLHNNVSKSLKNRKIPWLIEVDILLNGFPNLTQVTYTNTTKAGDVDPTSGYIGGMTTVSAEIVSRARRPEAEINAIWRGHPNNLAVDEQT